MIQRFSLAMIIVSHFVATTVAIASDSLLPGSVDLSNKGDGRQVEASNDEPAYYDSHYCGLYSAFAALNSLGIKLSFHEILDPRFISDRHGSTAADLMSIATTYRVESAFRTQIHPDELDRFDRPVILHTSGVVSKQFHHWVLLLGTEGGLLSIYDPPRGRYLLSKAELMTHWDGMGVIFGKDSRSAKSSFSVSIPTVYAFLLTIAISWFMRNMHLRDTTSTLLQFLAGPILIAALWHSTVEYGFLRNPDSVSTIVASFDNSTTPEVTVAGLEEMLKQGRVTVIDARPRHAFRKAHIPGAINIPTSTTHGELRDTLATIRKENRIVTYCASEECGWANMIAKQFPARGFNEVYVLSGGVRAWTKKTESTTGH